MLLVAMALALLVGSSPPARPCGAAVVHHRPNPSLGTLRVSRWIRVSSRTPGIVGVLFGGEQVGGRLALSAGGRNPFRGSNEKILWRFPARAAIGPDTTLAGRRLDGPGSFVEHLGEASSGQTPGRLFPSIVDVPRPGCWRLTLHTGRISGEAVALVRPPS
jgi:hypothetical protein